MSVEARGFEPLPEDLSVPGVHLHSPPQLLNEDVGEKVQTGRAGAV